MPRKTGRHNPYFALDAMSTSPMKGHQCCFAILLIADRGGVSMICPTSISSTMERHYSSSSAREFLVWEGRSTHPQGCATTSARAPMLSISMPTLHLQCLRPCSSVDIGASSDIRTRTRSVISRTRTRTRTRRLHCPGAVALLHSTIRGEAPQPVRIFDHLGTSSPHLKIIFLADSASAFALAGTPCIRS
jgi:transposase